MSSPRAGARRPKNRRAPGRARRILALALAVVVVGGGAWLAVREASDPRFALGPVAVIGVHRARAADVVAAARFVPGTNAWLLDVSGATRRIDSIPWIRAASVRRRWPNRVTIVVTERAPAARIRLPSSPEDPVEAVFALVDSDLEVLAVGPLDPRDAALPVLDVVPLPLDAALPGADLKRSAAAMALDASQKLAALGVRYSEIDIAPDVGISAVCAGNVRVVFGDEDALKQKVAVFAAIAPHIRNPAAVKYVDVRSPSTPTVLYK